MAERTSHVISYIPDFRRLKAGLNEIKRQNQKLGQRVGTDLGKGFEVVERRLDKISQKDIKIKGKRAKQTLKTFNTTVKDADGTLRKFTETQELHNGRLKGTTRTLATTNKTSRTLADNFKTLAKRAALTIPVWFAIRQGAGGFLRTIRDGIKDIVEFDRALQKARRNLQGTTDQINSNFKTLRQEITRLSLETGESTEAITNAFQKFATVGFGFQDSLEGATAALKGSVVLFGDAEDTANAFARTMRVLVDTSEGAASAGTQITEAIAQTAELWKTNAFELNEFTQSLEKFAPTANTANFSTQQTIALLAALSTGAVRGGRGGRLLRTSIVRLTSDIERLAKTLGVNVNPALDTTFDVFIRTLDALAELRSETGKVTPEFERLTKQIFGLRSGDAVRSLIALRKELKQNLSVLGDAQRLNEDFNNVLNTVSRQAQIFRNLNREIGKAFVTGIVGGDDFLDTLKRINEGLRNIERSAEIFGRSIRLSIGALTFDPNIVEGEVEKVIDDFQRAADAADSAFEDVSENIAKQIKNGLEGTLSAKEIRNLLTEIETFGADQLNTNQATLELIEKRLQKELEIAKIAEEEQQRQERVKTLEEDRQKIANAVLSDLETRLQAQGALRSEIIKAKQALIDRLGIQEDEIDAINRQLELQQAISEEQRLQSRLSSESIKLFRIAQEQGVDVARRVGEALSGEIDFDTFIRRGGQAVETFRKQFSDVFEQQQALAFFRGETIPGQTQLRGGQRIPIQEEAVRRGTVRQELIDALIKNRQEQTKSTERQQLSTQSIDKNTISTDENTKALNSVRLGLETALKAGQTIFPTNIPRGTQTNNVSGPRSIQEIVIRVEGQPGQVTIPANGRSQSELQKIAERTIAESTKRGTPANKILTEFIFGPGTQTP